MAECALDAKATFAELRSVGLDGFSETFDPNPAGDIKIFSRLPGLEIKPVYDDPNNHLMIRRMVFEGSPDILLVVMHFQSKLNWTDADQVHGVAEISRQISEEELKFFHKRTLLVGDLNMNPFENGVVGSAGLHAVMTKGVARQKSRQVNGKECHFFYNPMWRFFGERSDGPPGTFFYQASGRPIAFFWNIFDQVMVRPDLIDALQEVRIVDHAGASSLLSDRGLPDADVGSDHLPISFVLDFK